MIAIIPVAGKGTRLRPLTHSKPKALLRVGAKPIIGHIIDRLRELGCRHLIPIISVEGGDIPDDIRETYPDMTVTPVVQDEKLGLGHAVGLTEHHARGQEIIIVYGDTIIDGDLAGMVDRSVDGVIAVREVPDPRRFGVVTLEGDRITRFVEKPSKPESNLAIVGLNFFRQSDILFDCIRELIDHNITTRGEYQITDAFQRMVERGLAMKAYPIQGWFDAGTQETLLETNAYMLQKDANCTQLDGCIIVPPVYIPSTAKIQHSIIGPNVSVGDFAVVEDSIISDSIINDGARVVNCCLKESLIGSDAEVSERARRLVLGDHSSMERE